MLLPSGNPFKCHEEVLYFQLLIPPERFDIFSPRLWDAQKVQVHSDFSLNAIQNVLLAIRGLHKDKLGDTLQAMAPTNNVKMAH